MSSQPTPQPAALKPAALWVRVSTPGQAETSIPDQIDACRQKLQSEGYFPAFTLFPRGSTIEGHWGSQYLYDCPEFQDLHGLIAGGQAQAVCVYHRDRLECDPTDRMVFLRHCRENNVQLLVCQGPPVVNTREAELVEYVSGWAKRESVIRAQIGSKEGLHGRVTKRHLPVTFHKIYGYRWQKADVSLLPNGDWPTLRLIFDMLLGGQSYGDVIVELERRGIPSPGGNLTWNKQALTTIVRNPVYSGHYYGLKKIAVEPDKRRGHTYGRSSCRMKPRDEWQEIPSVRVENPLITPEQQSRLIDQAAKRQHLAGRNAKNDYLLRGLIVCGSHFGKQGLPRVYHGTPKNGSYAYVCPVGHGCVRPFIRGPLLDELVKFYIKCLLINKPDEFYPLSTKNRQKAMDDLAGQIREVEAKFTKRTQALADLEYRFSLRDGGVDPEAYQLARLKLNLEKKGLEETINELHGKKSKLGREKEAEEALETLATKYRLHLLSSDLTNAQWREIFVSLDFKIKVGFEGLRQCADMSDVVFGVGIPLSPVAVAPLSDKAVASIASRNPVPG